MWKTYLSPATLDEALAMLDQYGARARLVAGGTDLMVEVERGVRVPEVLIDLTRLPGMGDISLDTAGVLHIGPLVTHNQAATSALVRERAFPLARACWEVGAPQIRNRATIAGNLATASPANDTISPLWALQASITIRSVRGERTLSCEQFFKGVRKTALEPGELIADISVPAPALAQRGTFLKLGLRRAQAISIVNAAVVLVFDGDTVADARVALGSVAPTIVRAAEAERLLRGQVLGDRVIADAASAVSRSVTPISDVRGSADYRRYMTGVLVRQALESLAAKTERDTMPAEPVVLRGASDGRLSPGTPFDGTIAARVNGRDMVLGEAHDKSLLRLLREDGALPGTKEGCAEGECGACTVLLDGMAVMSCLTPAAQAHGRSVTTIEGLSAGSALHPVQQAFVAHAAVQCGYCTPGFVMSAAALLDERAAPDDDAIRQALAGNLCRCTGYYKILDAIRAAATHTDFA